jgi:hypothetical protein
MKIHFPFSFFLATLMVSTVLLHSTASVDKLASQKKAEEIGDHILQRFREARDFAPIFKEFFVSDVALRRREVELVFGQRLNPRHRGQIEQAAIERAYIALWNFWYLLTTYRFANVAEFEPPQEIGDAYNLLMKVDLEKVSTGRELDEKYTNKMNNFLDIVRKHIPQDVFESEIYMLNWARFKEEKETADVEQMRQDFGLRKEIEIYVVKREFFNYFLIQEGDTLKVFTMSLRTKRRL